MIQTLRTRLRSVSTTAGQRDRHPLFRVSMFFAAAALAVCITTVTESAAAAQSKSVWDGVYTQQQATRGGVSFATNCARCHDAEQADSGRRPLAGKAFWQSFRESSVEHLLDYVTRNMPNGAGGTLAANTYADLVAYILSRNDLPAGATELSKESAVGVQIIAKDGPGELPAGTLVRVVGCLAKKEGGGWILNSASAPERTNPGVGGDEPARPLGTRSYALMFVLTPLEPFVGHRLNVRGLLIGDGGSNGINVSTTASLDKTCQ